MSKRSVLVLLVWVSAVLCGGATLMGPVPLDRQNRGVEIIYDTPCYGYRPLAFVSSGECHSDWSALVVLQMKAERYKADAVISTTIFHDRIQGIYIARGLAVKWVKEGGQGND